MKWMNATSNSGKMQDALNFCTAKIARGFEGSSPDLLIIFVSQHHLFDYGLIVPTLRESFPTCLIMGTSAAAVIGDSIELEKSPGLSITAAQMEDVEYKLRHISNEDLPPLDGSPQPWRDLTETDATLQPNFIVLAEPFSCDSQKLIMGLEYAYPGSKITGGLASGAPAAGSNALICNDTLYRHGAVVLSIAGDVEMECLVSQGCRPIGQTHRVTKCEGHLLKELDGEKPLQHVQALFAEMDESEQEIASHSLFLGMVINELEDEFGHGDFLIRDIVGLHKETGMMAVASDLRQGQTVQFHLRDADRAAFDLFTRLRKYKESQGDAQSFGALLFSCLGRGVNLFGKPHHDAQAFQEELGPIPLGGFFCNGEFGPIGGRSHLHGYTSSFVIFRKGSQ